MIVGMSLAVCIGLQSTNYIFRPRDYQEVELFQRYLKLNSVGSWITRSGGWLALRANVSKVSIANLESSFQKQFGFRLDGLDESKFVSTLDNMEVGGPTVSAKGFISRFSDGSVMRKTYRRLLASERILASDFVEHCNYRIQPWLDSNLKLSEKACGAISIVRKDKRVTVQF